MASPDHEGHARHRPQRRVLGVYLRGGGVEIDAVSSGQQQSTRDRPITGIVATIEGNPKRKAETRWEVNHARRNLCTGKLDLTRSYHIIPGRRQPSRELASATAWGCRTASCTPTLAAVHASPVPRKTNVFVGCCRLAKHTRPFWVEYRCLEGSSPLIVQLNQGVARVNVHVYVAMIRSPAIFSGYTRVRLHVCTRLDI